MMTSRNADTSNPKQPTFSVAFVNLGCRVNHAEIEKIRVEIEEVGGFVAAPSSARYAVVNSCALTGEAEAKTRKAIRRLAAEPSIEKIFVTGCVANLFPNEVGEMSNKVHVYANKEALSSFILKEAQSKVHLQSEESKERACSIQAKSLQAPNQRNRREIKIQEGCSNACSYCIVWKARGRPQSVSVFSIKEQVEKALEEGIGEIVLTGINLGRFRLDPQAEKELATAADETSLATLIQYLLDETAASRIRLSSIEPTDIDDSLLEVMAQNPVRVARYLHIPLQAGSDKTLKNMNRNYKKSQFRDAVSRIRGKLPNIALATDIIAGFPGETPEDFEESLSFSQEMNFSKMHIFRYSKRPGTPAAERTDQVSAEEKAARSKKMAELATNMRESFAKNLEGKTVQVYVEEPGRGKTEGLFEARLPTHISPGKMYEGIVQSVQNDVLSVK